MDRLDSWKEIAAYLKRSVRTVHRWEKEEGLPVHRQIHKALGSVFAYKHELDAWSSARSVHPESAKPYRMVVAAAVVASVVLIVAIVILAPRRSTPARSGQDANVAGLELIATFAGSHRWPTFSPDGTSIAVFLGEQGRYGDYWIVPADGSEPRRVTSDLHEGGAPTWTPDGRSLVMDADGSNFTAVTEGPGELNIMPQWSGHGEALYFYQVRPSLTFRRIPVAGSVSSEIAPWSFGRQYQAAVDPRERTVVYSSVENGARLR